MNTSVGPLAGLNVIEMAGVGPGPFAGMLLSDLGASVIRVDRLGPSGLGVGLPREHQVNSRGRRSIALDLKQPQGQAVVLKLVEGADALIEGFRPGVMEKMGLGPATCHERNPGLIYGRITGFGQTGPLAHAAGHDMNYIALTGALHAIGPQGGKPVPPLNLVGDYGGGALYLVVGLLAALWERQRSGKGQVVDAAMVDGAASLAGIFMGLMNAGQWNPSLRGANVLDGGAPFYDTYETADGQYVSLGPIEPKFFELLVKALELPDAPRWLKAQYQRSEWPALRQAMASAVKQRSRDAWCQRLEGTDVCFAPVLRLDEARHHHHAQARAAYVQVDGHWQPAPAPRFNRTPAGQPKPAPAEGEHTEAVLAELGMAAGEVAALRQQGVIR